MLQIDRMQRNAILLSAGYAADGDQLGPDRTPGFMFSPDEARHHIEQMPWPAFVANEFLEVVSANSVAQRLWRVDFSHDLLRPLQRNLLGVASSKRFIGCVRNWDEALTYVLGVFKGHHRGPVDPDNPGPYFSKVMDDFFSGDAAYVARFESVWQRTAPLEHKVRWFYPVVWSEPGVGQMSFRCLVTTANDPDGLAFNDWIPEDATTWDNIAKMMKTAQSR